MIDDKTWAPRVETSAYVKEPLDVQTYLQLFPSGALYSHSCFVTLIPNQEIAHLREWRSFLDNFLDRDKLATRTASVLEIAGWTSANESWTATGMRHVLLVAIF